MTTDTDEIEALRASVRPILATLGAPHEHDRNCTRPECWYAVVERAAMAVVAEAWASALRETPCKRINGRTCAEMVARERTAELGRTAFRHFACSPCKRVAAAEALVAAVRLPLPEGEA